MNDLLYSEVPSLNLAEFYSGDANQKKKFVNELGIAYSNIGFVAIKNHFLSTQLQDELYAVVKEFFSLPQEIKQQYEINGLAGQRGYTGREKEHAKGRSIGDLKEFYHVGCPIDTEFGYPDNVWPEEVPLFKTVTESAFELLEKTGLVMLQAIALFLGLPENYFSEKVSHGNSILRPIHYFPIENLEKVKLGAVRAAEHGDINLITLLMGASAEGLQVLRHDGKWISVNASPQQLIVNVGDMLERLTNGKLKSTIHRVVNPPLELLGNPRYSIPFFMHPRPDMHLSCLENCIDEYHPKKFEDITAQEFLEQRLMEIGLKK